ncbi:MAG: hypothetical protein R2774_06835 [Saprospiraceae bacterium]
MIRVLLILIAYGFTDNVSGQYVMCDSLLLPGYEYVFDADGIKNTVDYVKTYHPKQRRYISNRNHLKKINVSWNTDTSMIFRDDDFFIKLIFDYKKVDPSEIFDPKEDGETYSNVRDYSYGTPFGISSEDTIGLFLKEISINELIIPPKFYSDLLNPNRYETFISIRPIEIYKSIDENCLFLYIYIYGRPNMNLMSYHDNIDKSYMAKLIITTKGYYVDRIVIPGHILKYFGFGECPYFIGF